MSQLRQESLLGGVFGSVAFFPTGPGKGHPELPDEAVTVFLALWGDEKMQGVGGISLVSPMDFASVWGNPTSVP